MAVDDHRDPGDETGLADVPRFRRPAHDWPMHRVRVKTRDGALAAAARLIDAGYDPTIGGGPDWAGFTVDFLAPKDERLEFLRPHILPPLEAIT